MEVLLPLLAFLGIMTGVLVAAAKAGANAPIEPNPPRERPKRVYAPGDRVLAKVAEEHGLRHDVDVASGRVGDLSLEIAAVPDGTAPTRFTGVARFRRSLGLELVVEQRGSFGGRSGDTVVSKDFDHDFAVDALHLDQARALLEGPVAQAFTRAANRSLRVALDDESLSVAVDAGLGPERGIEAMSWLVTTARAIEEARARVKRPAMEQGMVDAFTSLAQGLGGNLHGDELRLDLEEGELGAHVDRVSGKEFRTTLRLSFEKPLALDLRLGLESQRSRFERFRYKDIQLGDELFDEVFVVLGEPEEDVAAALDEPLRELLLTLHEGVDALLLSPTEIEVAVNRALADRDELETLVGSMREVARKLAPKRREGAYR